MSLSQYYGSSLWQMSVRYFLKQHKHRVPAALNNDDLFVQQWNLPIQHNNVFGQIQQNNVMQRKYRCLKNILGQGIMDTRQNKMRPMLNTQLIVT